jgi:hypothetical protein
LGNQWFWAAPIELDVFPTGRSLYLITPISIKDLKYQKEAERREVDNKRKSYQIRPPKSRAMQKNRHKTHVSSVATVSPSCWLSVGLTHSVGSRRVNRIARGGDPGVVGLARGWREKFGVCDGPWPLEWSFPSRQIS